MAVEISSQYKYTGRGPLDSKFLVETYADLLTESTLLTKSGKLSAYNGMIVAVWLNKDDSTKNGIYFLHDNSVANTFKAPDVSVEANWHKLKSLDEGQDIDTALFATKEALEAVIGNVEADYNSLEKIANVVKNQANTTAEDFAELRSIIDTDNVAISTYVTNQIATLVQPKESTEVSVSADGTLGIKELNVNKLVQTPGETLILSGGTATVSV